MLYFVLTWTVLLIVCGVIGVGMLHFLRANAFQRSGDRLIVAIWLGVILLAVLLLLLSLFVPLSIWTGLLVSAGLCGLALWDRATRLELARLKANFTRTPIWLYLIGAVGVAALASQAVTWLDTGLYHYPLIQWLHQIGTVPGLALLFANFGFTSSWFAFAAPLNPPLLDSRASAVTGGFVLLMALIQTGVGLGWALSAQSHFSDWFLGLFSSVTLICLIGSPHLREISISPSPDVPIFVLTGIVVWTILVIVHSLPSVLPQSSHIDSSLVTLILAIGAVTIKLTALPLLVIGCGFYLVRNYRSLIRLGDGLAALTLLFGSFLMAQILTSGCPLFPSTTICLALPWSVPAEMKQWVVTLTHDWTNWYATASESVSLPVALLYWFNSNRGNQIMALVALLSLVALGILFKLLRQGQIRGGGWVVATQVVGVGFYLKTSPLLRFALPCLTLIPVLLISSYCHTRFCVDLPGQVGMSSSARNWQRSWASKGTSRWTEGRLAALWLPSLLALAVVVSVRISPNFSLLVVPPPLQTAPLAQKQVNDITYFAPQNRDVCWATALPCAFEIPPDVHLRDASRGIAAGFVRL